MGNLSFKYESNGNYIIKNNKAFEERLFSKDFKDNLNSFGSFYPLNYVLSLQYLINLMIN